MVTRRVYESWIWHVFNPLIEHCDRELQMLPDSLTFRMRGNEGVFLRLLPMRLALLYSGKSVFDDMKGDNPEFDALVASHDGALTELLAAAVAADRLLKQDVTFVTTVRDAARRLQEEGFPVDGDETSLVDLMAVYAINGLAADLSPQFLNPLLWNKNRDALLSVAAQHLAAVVHSKRAFEGVVRHCRERLAGLRKSLSREYDIPVAPSASGDILEEVAG